MEGLKNEIELKCLSVLCGDSILLRFLGTDGLRHNILVDGGFVKTYKSVLKPELEKVVSNGEIIDLLIATHYDGDHIGGLIQLINDRGIDLQTLVNQWWLNCDLPLLHPEGAIAIDQLLTLKKVLQEEGKYPEVPIVVGCPSLDLFGAQLTVLSPDSIRYNLAKSLIEAKSTEIASARNDYDYPIAFFEEKVRREPEEDKSPANGSSIAVLFRLNGAGLLLLGDAFPSVVSRSIRDMGHDEIGNPLPVQCIKVSHHASKGNISNELLSLVKTKKFIVSANAINRDNLPNKETIVRILLNGKRGFDDYFEFYFTHKNDVLESMFAIDGPGVYEQWRFHMNFPNDGQNWISVL